MKLNEDVVNGGIELAREAKVALPEEFSKLSKKDQNLFRRLLYERKFNLIIEKNREEFALGIAKKQLAYDNLKKMPLRNKRKAK
jgi:hypothetical protein